MKSERVTYLIVDDDEVVVLAIKRAMKQWCIVNPVESAGDGVEALEKLRAFERERKPCIVLLDLEMPRMGGIEFLDHLRADALLRPTIVFVLTTSNSPKDIAAAYARNIAGYLVKENACRSIRTAIGTVDSFLRTVTFPD